MDLMILVLVALTPGIIIMISAFIYHSIRTKSLWREINNSNFTIGYPIKISTEAKYKKWIKFWPWNGYGFIGLAENKLSLYVIFKKQKGRIIKIKLDSSYIVERQSLMKNGAFTWIEINTDIGIIYIAADVGPFIFGIDSCNRYIKRFLIKYSNYCEIAQQGDAPEPASPAR